MTTAYTTLLGLALPVQGELSGTWGDTVNDYITQYLDAAVAGAQVISGSQTAVTLSKTTDAALSQAGAGATGSSQYQIISCTGNPAGLLTITAPAASKVYLILNNTSTSQSVKIVGTGPTTGVTVAAGRNALVAWNGADFELVASTDAATLSGVLAVANGGTGQSSLTANNVLLGNGTSAVQFVAPGTSGNVLTSNGTTWTSSTPAESMVYPGVGIAVSTGTAWGTSKTSPTGDVVGTSDTQTLTNKTIEAGTFTNGYTEEVATANTSTAYTINLANGSVQILTLTGNCTFTFPTATAGKSFIMLLKQDATGSRTVTWPAAVKWPNGTAPTITSTASKLDKYIFTSDGTNWYGSNAGQNYTV